MMALSFGDMNAIANQVANDPKQPEFLRCFAKAWEMADEPNTDILVTAWIELIGKYHLDVLIQPAKEVEYRR